MRPMITKALIAAAGVALLAQTAAAQTTTANDGDLILSLRASSGTGFGTDYEVDLGAASLYFGVAPNTVPFTVSGVSVTDLSATFGSSWSTRSDLYWGIIGSSGYSGALSEPAYTIWASSAEGTSGAPSTPWSRGSQSAQALTDSYVASVYDGFRGSPVAGSQAATIKPASSPNSFEMASHDPNEDIGTFGAYYPSIEGTASTGLDLYGMEYGTRAGGTIGADGDRIGTFYFDGNNNNALTFASVPEPGTCVLLGAGGLAALWLRGRSFRKQA